MEAIWLHKAGIHKICGLKTILSPNRARTQIVRTFWWTKGELYEFWNKGSDGGQFEDIEVTEIILGVGESYDVKIILPDITDAKAYDPIIVRLVKDHLSGPVRADQLKV